MKPLVIYHDRCSDGFGAAFAAWLKLGEEAEYLPMQYGKQCEEFCTSTVTGREVYILDFSLPRNQMEEIFRRASRVVWLDHHHTSRSTAEALCEYDTVEMKDYARLDHEELTWKIVHDNNCSGALIAWEYFHPDAEVPMLIRHIDDYDRWQFKLEGTKAFNKALWSHAPWSFGQWQDMILQAPDVCADMCIEGAAILRAHEQNVHAVVKGATRECNIPIGSVTAAQVRELRDNAQMTMHEARDILMSERPTVKGLAANCPPHLTSDVGHAPATQSGTYGLLWSINKDGKCKCSLRSNGDYDVSAIAKAFGGGGHRNAAGFEVPVETLLGWLK